VLPELTVLAWLALCAWCDLRSRQIANWLTLPALGLALLVRLAGLAPGPPGLVLIITLFAAAGWWRGWVGGADLKVTAALAALNPHLALWAWGGALLYRLGLGLARRPARRLPGLVGFLLGVILSEIWSVVTSITTR
jgi:Flp pilus assembly protein protease CpaA